MAEKIGSGRRFRGLEAKLAGRPGVKNPGGLAAAIGRKKYGKKRFAQLAQAGKRREEEAPGPKKPPRRIRV
jgi:hypothetical protein